MAQGIEIGQFFVITGAAIWLVFLFVDITRSLDRIADALEGMDKDQRAALHAKVRAGLPPEGEAK